MPLDKVLCGSDPYLYSLSCVSIDDRAANRSSRHHPCKKKMRLQALAVMEGRQCLCQRWPAAAAGAVRHLPSANASCNESKRFAVSLQCSHSVCCSTGVSAFTNALLAPPNKKKTTPGCLLAERKYEPGRKCPNHINNFTALRPS